MKKTKKPVKKAAAKSAVKSKPRAAAPAKKAAPARKAAPGKDALTAQELAEIAAKLTEMRIDLAKNVEDKRNLDMGEPEVGDSIDQATQSLDKEILFELSDNERKMLGDIEGALRKMSKGTYGSCEHCKRTIEKKRIKALPSARYCMACQSGSEKTRGE
ncbi:MAG: TraR/DksA family transcriptional regulator [Elusimicrobia bacterium]|jgi:DnaK suppressor protein|nr:TraR/DksA family transcriptional regulator [Elusimicrobiota bacterium]